jgi:hypothetical protein
MRESAIDELELVFLPAQRPELYGMLVGYCFTHAVSRARLGVKLTARLVHSLHRFEYLCLDCEDKVPMGARPAAPRRALPEAISPGPDLSAATATNPTARTGGPSTARAGKLVRDERAALKVARPRGR